MQTIEAWVGRFQTGTVLATGHSCEILAKKLAAFCLCHKNLPEATLKKLWSNFFGKVKSVAWLLLEILM